MEPLNLLHHHNRPLPLSKILIIFTFSLLFPLSLSNSDNIALLTFKSSSDTTSNSLSSWSSSNSNSTSCSWFGVTCDPSSQRVIKLVLDNLNLTGSIQPLTRLTHLRLLSLNHNRFIVAPESFSSWPNLKHLYLSHNQFTGKFPAGVGGLRRLRRLDLSYNRFSGKIPMTELTQLTHLLTLRLNSNSFTGNLDSGNFFSTSISQFNVSNNELSGRIPNWLSKFPLTSFSGNVHLCGSPIPGNCSNKPISINSTVGSDPVQMGPTIHPKDKSMSNKVVALIIVGDAFAVAATLVIVTCYCYKTKYTYNKEKDGGAKMAGKGERISSGNEKMVCFEGCKGFGKVDELLRASAEMLGKGSVGTTYKVLMEGGDLVVVKRVRERRKRKEVDGFLKEIGGLRHGNVVGLRAYYSSLDELLLVYDFFPNGSLHSLLHANRGPGRTPLDWTTRLKIAAGSAGGIAFIHAHNKSKLFHGHLTSSNILIDQKGNACISDIGLHQLFQIPSSPNNPYNAPELILDHTNQNRKFSQKSDVYSFGVILLEMLTGKMVTGEGEAAVSLVKWVRKVVGEKWTWEVFDFELMRYKEMEDEMMALLKVALLCLAQLPKNRPKMSEVHKMIVDIKRKDVANLDELSSDHSTPNSLVDSTPNFITS